MSPELVHILDIVAALVGVAYLWWEFKASIWVWVAGMIMPAINIALFWEKGLYGDFALAIYYLLAAAYGFFVWKFGRQPEEKERPITRMKPRKWLPVGLVFCALWAAMYLLLDRFTNSTVPVLDSLTNALSIVGMYLLAQKYLEQWFVWLVADLVYVWLYAIKGLPGQSALYALYCLVSVAGYFNWRRKCRQNDVSLRA